MNPWFGNRTYSTFQVCEIHSSCRDTALPCPYGILNVLHKPAICCIKDRNRKNLTASRVPIWISFIPQLRNFKCWSERSRLVIPRFEIEGNTNQLHGGIKAREKRDRSTRLGSLALGLYPCISRVCGSEQSKERCKSLIDIFTSNQQPESAMNIRYCSPKIRRSPLSYCALCLITLFLAIGCVNPAIYIKTTTETEATSSVSADAVRLLLCRFRRNCRAGWNSGWRSPAPSLLNLKCY